MGVIKEVVQVLVDIGLLDVILPFIVVFSISWSVLERSQVLGDNGSRYNSIVAFVLGFFVVAALQVVTIISTIMQWSAVFIILISFSVVFAKFLGGDLSGPNLPKIISLIIVAVIAMYALGVSNWLSVTFLERYILPLLIVVLSIGGILYFILQPSRQENSSSNSSEGAEQGPTRPDGPSHRYVGRVTPQERTRDL